jgi:hypothetical protein
MRAGLRLIVKAKAVAPPIKWTCVISLICFGVTVIQDFIPDSHISESMARAAGTNRTDRGEPSIYINYCTTFELSASKGAAEDERTREVLLEESKAGSTPALEKLGLAYYSGALGLKQNYLKAKSCFFEAALQGDRQMGPNGKCPKWQTQFCPGVSILGRIYLAKMFASGLGGRKDTVKAEDFLIEATRVSFDPVLNKELDKEITVLQKANDENEAKEEQETRAAERRGMTTAQRMTADFYSNFTADWVCNGMGQCGNRIRLRTPGEQASPEERDQIQDMVTHMKN